MTPDAAELVAIEALAWLAETDDLMPVFLGSTGASADDVRNAARTPEFLGSVLEFVMMDDAWVVAFCDRHGHGYDTPMRARAVLPGGDFVHWT